MHVIKKKTIDWIELQFNQTKSGIFQHPPQIQLFSFKSFKNFLLQPSDNRSRPKEVTASPGKKKHSNVPSSSQ